MTNEKIKALIAQVEEMIDEQNTFLKMATVAQNWSQVTDLNSKISGMRQVLSVIRLYEE